MPTTPPDRSLRIAALSWFAALQFFLMQGIVAAAWSQPFSLSERYISDLGNTACAPYPAGSTSYVCSPWHAEMNASFVLLGLTMLVGSAAAIPTFRARWRRDIGLLLLGVAGLGVILVGRYPENVDHGMHTLGAALNFIPGNGALVLLGLAGLSGEEPRWFRPLTVGMGLVGLVATWLFVRELDLGLGPGGMERIAAYPQTLWQIVAGVVLWRRLDRFPDRAEGS